MINPNPVSTTPTSSLRFTLVRVAIIALLAINVLSITGQQVRPVLGVSQAGPTTFSPFGPATNTLIFQFYSGFDTMFTNFRSGQIDITDWPANPPDLSGFASNPDYYLTSPTSEFGVFQLDINNHPALFGVSQQTPRVTGPPGIITQSTATAATCATGFGQLNVILVNKEANNAPVRDVLNTVTASGPQTFTVSDSSNGGASEPDGNYTLPTPPTCMLTGTYTVSALAYAGTARVTVGSSQIVTVTLGVNYNSPSTVKLTQLGIESRRAMAHLLNKPEFILGSTLQGLATCDDLFAPPSQNLLYGSCNPLVDKTPAIPQSVLDEDCAEHPWFNPGNCHPAAAYLLNNTLVAPSRLWWANTGTIAGSSQGYPSTSDIRAACDHLVAAGFAITPSSASCQDVARASVGTSPKPGYPHLVTSSQVIFYIRTHPPREAFGQIIADGLNFLFGTANNGATLGAAPTNVACAVNYGFKSAGSGCAPQYYGISDVSNIVFGDGLSPDQWGLYTGGYSLTSTPDDLYATFHSQFSSNVCGGMVAGFPNNYRFYCDPSYDGRSSAAEFSGSLNQATNLFSDAGLIMHRTLPVIPVFSRYEQFVALNAWSFQGVATPQPSSLVAGLGTGFQAGSVGGLWSLMNMRCNTNYTPVNLAFRCGGGTSGIIRRSVSQDTSNLSPFTSTTVWEFDIIDSIYDTMLQPNPSTGGSGLQLIDWMTTSHTASFNPNEVSCIGANCVNGTTTQVWHLRSDLKFHDGVSVTADDVVFSIIALRDVPSAIFQPNVANVVSATALGPSTVQVKLIHESPFYEANIGSIPIMPKHIWAPLCGSPIGAPGNRCGDPIFDPMAAGILVGSGAWICNNPSTGLAGGSCSQNSDGSIGGQAITFGGKIMLKANPTYMRGPRGLQGTSLQGLSWADRNNDGVVNILDVADVAFHFGMSDPYWDHPLYGVQVGVVDIGEVSTVAFYFGHGTTTPFTTSQLASLDPQIDPFSIDLTGSAGPVMYYQGGLLSSGQLAIRLAATSGTPNAALFTGALLNPSGTTIATSTGVAGSSPSIVLLSFGTVTSGSYQLKITFNQGSRPTYAISLNI